MIAARSLGNDVEIPPPVLFVDQVVPVGAHLPDTDFPHEIEHLKDLQLVTNPFARNAQLRSDTGLGGPGLLFFIGMAYGVERCEDNTGEQISP